MPSSPVRILIPNAFESQLTERLTIAHDVIPLKGQSEAEIRELLETADVLVNGAYKPEWSRPSTLRPLLVHSTGAGVDGISMTSLPARSIVCNVYGHERGVAEQAFLHMLALQKGLPSLDRALRAGNWSPQTPYLPEMRARRLLILGAGHIGRELVRWGRFLGMDVVVVTRKASAARAAEIGVTEILGLERLDDELPKADFVVVAIPAAPGTIDLIDARRLKTMKKSAFIVNVGRAPVINEDALFDALSERTIAGAGLDVWYQYPVPGQIRLPSRRPFQELDNVVMTPHKPTVETMEFRWGEIAKNIARHMSGQPLVNVVWTTP